MPCGGCRAGNTKQRGRGLGAPAGGLPRQGWAPCRWPGYRGQRGGICLRLLKTWGAVRLPPSAPRAHRLAGAGHGAARSRPPGVPAASCCCGAGPGRSQAGWRAAGSAGMAARNLGTELGKGLGPRGGQGRGETTRGGGGPASGLPSGSLPPRLRAPWGCLPSRLPPVASRGLPPTAGSGAPWWRGVEQPGCAPGAGQAFRARLFQVYEKVVVVVALPQRPACLPAWRGSGTAEPVGRVDMACSRAGSSPVPLPGSD